MSLFPNYPLVIRGGRDKPIGSVINIGVDLSQDIFLEKRHDPTMPRYFGDKLIVLVRDYKECIIRNCHGNSKIELSDDIIKKRFDTDTTGDMKYSDYIGILKKYNNWDDGYRLLIYYESLIMNRKHEINRIVDFLDLDHSRKNLMFKDLDMHFRRCLKLYSPKSHSKGRKLKYHQNMISEEIINYMNYRIKTRHSRLYKKYLFRYG